MRREHFQTHFMRYQNQIKTLQGKKKERKQANIPDEKKIQKFSTEY